MADHQSFVSKDKKPTISPMMGVLRQSGQRNLFPAGYRVFCTLFLLSFTRVLSRNFQYQEITGFLRELER